MSKQTWHQTMANVVFGRDAQLRRHVKFASSSLLSYAVTVGVLLHAMHMGLLGQRSGIWLTSMSAVLFLLFYGLVRSGWSQRFADPVLAFPHSLASITLCMGGYLALGNHRSDATILIAQTIVLSMLRLRPSQTLWLGVYAVALLLACVTGQTVSDPVTFPPSSSIAHFLVGGAALLSLSFVAKWISELRVRVSRQARELQAAIDKLEEMATHDVLTGAFNRRIMTEMLELELTRVGRDSPLCVALIDLDHFKQINDCQGHQAGDAVLMALAAHATGQLRQIDKLSRWGGEEFLLMLPAITLANAFIAVERVRETFEALRLPDRPQLKATFSAGLAQARPGETLEQLVERADHALYAAKHQGRNRCVMAPQPGVSQTPGAQQTQELTS